MSFPRWQRVDGLILFFLPYFFFFPKSKSRGSASLISISHQISATSFRLLWNNNSKLAIIARHTTVNSSCLLWIQYWNYFFIASSEYWMILSCAERTLLKWKRHTLCSAPELNWCFFAAAAALPLLCWFFRWHSNDACLPVQRFFLLPHHRHCENHRQQSITNFQLTESHQMLFVIYHRRRGHAKSVKILFWYEINFLFAREWWWVAYAREFHYKSHQNLCFLCRKNPVNFVDLCARGSS